MKGKAGPVPEARETKADKPNGKHEETAPQLFSEPPVVKRSLRVPLTPEDYADINQNIAAVAVEFCKQKQMEVMAKETAKGLQAQQAQLVSKLTDPYKMQEVDCRWQFRMDKSEKDLVRIDNGEVIETRPMSAEDREQEIARAVTENQVQTAAVTA